LKKLQHPEVALGIYIAGFQGDERLKFGNGEIGTPLVQVLLSQPGVLGDLLLAAAGRLGEERNGDQGQDCGTEFFFTRIAFASYQFRRPARGKGRAAGPRHTVVL
jgi:hypothetical protein